jgi:hypothetical protein
MEATPFEHAGDVARATKWTGETALALPEVETLAAPGDETYTPASAGNENKTNKTKVKSAAAGPDFLARI